MNGILLIDKEPDWTSSDVVAKLRGVLHEKRIGHSGTLDPMATGLLVVFVGRATRAAEFAGTHDKRYLASLRLGTVTDTQDITGNVIRTQPAVVSERRLREVLESFRGEQLQIPPMYSAIKIRGRKLYEIARSGGEVEREPRPIRINDISLAGCSGGDWLLDISCSKGTYVRTLCNDIGERLGCGGCMSALRRVSAGPFSVDDALTIDEVRRAAGEGRAEKLLIGTDRLFEGPKKCTASSAIEKKIRCGAEIKTGLPDGEYRVYSGNGDFLMLGRVAGGTMKTVKSFFEV